jgi:hypothetical protein
MVPNDIEVARNRIEELSSWYGELSRRGMRREAHVLERYQIPYVLFRPNEMPRYINSNALGFQSFGPFAVDYMISLVIDYFYSGDVPKNAGKPDIAYKLVISGNSLLFVNEEVPPQFQDIIATHVFAHTWADDQVAEKHAREEAERRGILDSYDRWINTPPPIIVFSHAPPKQKDPYNRDIDRLLEGIRTYGTRARV